MSSDRSTPNSARIYLSPPDVRGREKALLLDAVESNWIAPLGPHVDAFEQEMAEYIGVKHALALSSGTAALHLALLNLGVGVGDTVLCSTLTFVATANAVRYTGAEPVFVDANVGTWNLCPARLEEALGAMTAQGRPPKAIIVVDLYGQCADYDAILEIAARYSVPVIEDAAEALGARHGAKKAGSLAAMGVFSFNGNKIITTSGGGMLVSNHSEWIERARYLATQARMPVLHYEHEDVGYNYRLSNLLAAVGRAQLETLDARIACRRNIRSQYRDALAELPGLSFMPEAEYGASNAWLTCVLIDGKRFGASRDMIIARLNECDIEARPVWKPMHLQPVYRDCERYGGDVAKILFDTGLCLPSGSNMSGHDVARVCDAIRGCGRRK